MNGLPYYPRYPRDFLEGTAGMPFELKAAYGLVLDLIYMMGERGLPDDPHFISGHLGMSVRKWNIVREKLIEVGKLNADLGIISNKRADKEKIIQRKSRDNNSESARKRWKNNTLPNASAYPISDTDTDTEERGAKAPAKIASKITSKSEDSPSVILASVASMEASVEFVEHRREIKKPITTRAAKAMAEKLRGHGNPDAVLMESISNGWQGIFPDKVKAKRRERQGHTNAGYFGNIPERG